MNTKLLAIAFSGTLLLSGCATVGNHKLASMDTSVAQSTIVKGKSTKNDVIALLGEPTSESPANGSISERWVYSSSHAVPQGSNFIPFAVLFYNAQNITSKAVVVDFDENGIVKDFSAKERESKVTGGIFG